MNEVVLVRFSLNKTITGENNKFSFNVKITEPGELVGEFVIGTSVLNLTKIQVATLSPIPIPTPTPTPTPTPIPIPIPTPTPNNIVYSFGDMPTSENNSVNGIHGGIDFGTDIWGAGNYFGFNATSGWFLNNDSDNRSFILPINNCLKSIKLSTGIENSSWSISDSINPAISGIFASVNTPIIVKTDWRNAGTNITITFSAGWDSGINEITYGKTD